MSATTGPIAAAAAISYGNQVIGNGQPWDSELIIVVGAAAAAVILALAERAVPRIATGVAWIALVTAILYTPPHGRSAAANALKLTGL